MEHARCNTLKVVKRDAEVNTNINCSRNNNSEDDNSSDSDYEFNIQPQPKPIIEYEQSIDDDNNSNSNIKMNNVNTITSLQKGVPAREPTVIEPAPQPEKVTVRLSLNNIRYTSNNNLRRRAISAHPTLSTNNTDTSDRSMVSIRSPPFLLPTTRQQTQKPPTTEPSTSTLPILLNNFNRKSNTITILPPSTVSKTIMEKSNNSNSSNTSPISRPFPKTV